jgi:hypothetical protein
MAGGAEYRQTFRDSERGAAPLGLAIDHANWLLSDEMANRPGFHFLLGARLALAVGLAASA